MGDVMVRFKDEDRWALWEKLGHELDQELSRLGESRHEVAKREKHVAFLNGLRAALVPRPCRQCNGTGDIEVIDENQCETTEDCPVCKGKREVPE